jgi:putative peptidoglycan lipid II flippase
MLVLNVPATLGLMALSTPIVGMLFERGQFLPSDTAATAAALEMYAVGLVGYSTARIASPVFYALGQPRVPVAISVGSMVVNVVASLSLVHAMGFRGLALGTSIAAWAHGGLALLLLRSHLSGIDGAALLSKFLRIIVAAGAMAAAAMGTERLAVDFLPGSSLAVQAGRLSLAIGAGLATLAVSASLLRVPEAGEAIAGLRSRVGRLLGR